MNVCMYSVLAVTSVRSGLQAGSTDREHGPSAGCGKVQVVVASDSWGSVQPGVVRGTAMLVSESWGFVNCAWPCRERCPSPPWQGAVKVRPRGAGGCSASPSHRGREGWPPLAAPPASGMAGRDARPAFCLHALCWMCMRIEAVSSPMTLCRGHFANRLAAACCLARAGMVLAVCGASHAEIAGLGALDVSATRCRPASPHASPPTLASCQNYVVPSQSVMWRAW